MYKNLRWKLLTITAVFVVFFAVGVYPMLAERYHWPIPEALKSKALKLGLDLKGGVQLTMRVNTDDALKTTTTSTAEQLRTSLTTSTIPATINVLSPTVFRVEGIRRTATRSSAPRPTRSPWPTSTATRCRPGRTNSR